MADPPPPQSPPALLTLVDAAIMGSRDSLDRLRSLVSADLSASSPVIDALLSTISPGVADIDSPFVMQSSRAAVVVARLLPSLPPSPHRTRASHILLSVLTASSRNRSMCSSAGLLRVLLETAEEILDETTTWDAMPLCDCIELLAGHSLPVPDLRFWLRLVTKLIATDWALTLMLALESAMKSQETKGPACTFELDGESSGLAAPGEAKWPFANGYAFATWIYVESFPMDSLSFTEERDIEMPRLFSFAATDEDFGLEAYFHGQFLVVEYSGGKGKKSSLHFSYLFKPQCWYFVGVEHSCKHGLLGKAAESEVRLYVDGNLHDSHQFDLLKVSKPLAFCFIGTNPPPAKMEDSEEQQQRQCPLFAEMGPVYIFKEPIGQERMARLAARGGDALPSFGSGAGPPWRATSEHVRNLAEESCKLDAEIEGSLYLLYHPSLLSGRLCHDASPSGSAGQHRRPAEVLGQVHLAARIRPAESLWALAYGGPMALLPLTVSNVQMGNLEPVLGDFPLSLATASLSTPIFRIISIAIQHSGNNEELCRTRAPQLLSRILHHVLSTLSNVEFGKQNTLSEEELVAAIVSLCRSQKDNHALKVQLLRSLLLDLKMWSMCKCGLQKKLLSSLADLVFSESLAMRDANALQMLLDGCRRCYWVLRETDSIGTFTLHGPRRPVGEVNALVDELLVIVELLVVAASPSFANDDVRCLISFLVDSPQPNQVARVLQLIYRLVVQPNTSRAETFAQSFISCGGVEALLVLLQREAKTGNRNVSENTFVSGAENVQKNDSEMGISSVVVGRMGNQLESSEKKEPLSTSAESARNNVYNIDKGDGVAVGIINLLGAVVQSGHLKFGSSADPQNQSSNIWSSVLHEESSTMFGDKVSLLLFALQKAFQAASQRLMTTNVYMALMGAALNVSSTDDGLTLYDYGHRFEHVEILLVLLRSLPYASRDFEARAIQDLLFLACSRPENRTCLTCMAEWPDWILEVLISNYEMGSSKDSNDISFDEIEDLIHNFLMVMLEYSMRQKDGWKDIESIIHCAEWLCMIGGSTTGDQRIRRQEALPIFKRRFLGGLLDFVARELRVQTEVIAAASAGYASEGLSPEEAKAGAENAAHLSVTLTENSIVILMLVEDHLRLQGQLICSLQSTGCRGTPASRTPSTVSRSNSFSRTGSESFDSFGSKRLSISSDTGGLSPDLLASVADANGQVSAAVMECLTAAAAAEPYESVRGAFVSFGSCTLDLIEGWKYRSRLWYGVALPSTTTAFGGGGSGWESWKSALEKDSNGYWIELPLVKKSINMLQALLLEECGITGGLGIGSGTGMGGMKALHQLLDSDQPFLCMLRLVLASMREDDCGEEDVLVRNTSTKEIISEGFNFHALNKIPSDNNNLLSPRKPRSPRWRNPSITDDMSEGHNFHASNMIPSDNNNPLSPRKPLSSLLWSVLSPILNMPVSESKRQRVLVASCILYSEVWHAIGKDGKPLRKMYLEAILPPFVAILRRWRPLLTGIHEFTSSDGDNPLVANDRALAADVLPLQAALSMICPGWAAAFASPPAAMALAMIAAGTAGGETVPPPRSRRPIRRDTSFSSLFERRITTKLHTFSSFQMSLETSNEVPPGPKDKAAAKAAALAAARDLERNAKIGSGRGLCAVAMATSAQRRSASDTDRVKRWSISEAMAAAWTECLQPFDSKSVSGKDFSALSYKYVAVLVTSFALARSMQRVEIDRRTQVEVLCRHHVSTGARAWQKLLHCLIEMSELFGPFGGNLCRPERVFWKLDLMESCSRIRRNLKRNYKGSNHLDAAADYEDMLHLQSTEKSDQLHANDPEALLTTNLHSSSSILIVKDICIEDNNDDDQDTPTSNSEHDLDNQQRLLLSSEQSLPEHLDARNSGASSDENLLQSTLEVAPGFLPIEADERILVELPSLMVRPLKLLRGNFQITTKRINFIIDENIDDSSSGNTASSAQKLEQGKNRSWLMSSLRQIFSRRYLLRRSALELFMVDRSNFFFDFGSIEGRKNVYRAIVQARPPHLKSIYLETQRPGQLLKRTQLMERWARWEISNFEYLMELNTLAGRSYNDITQYPVFPWVLADYCSSTLDLGKFSSYRDLSKPVGALNPDRLKKFQERYSRSQDPNIPKFHYSSHYSSAATVLYYLVHVEPFTTLSLKLHGGRFGSADHMFSDINSTWKGVLEDMNNVKELVPEMFYLPEMLTSENSVHLGTTQLGGNLDSVKLPPWAANSVDFIYKHRMALESEHVSAHLHEWIDLIFGYKQRGKEAVSANNVFLYITYEGVVDIDKIEDRVQRRAIQNQIAYFGQTPSQLMTVPHLKRRPLADVLHLKTIFRNPGRIKPHIVPSPEHCNVPASVISASNDSVIVVDQHAPSASVAMHKWHPNTPDGHGIPFLFHHGKAATGSNIGALMRMFKGPAGSSSEDWQFPRALAFAASGIRSSAVVAVTREKEIVTGGHADNSIKLISADGAKTIETAGGHIAPVTCLALSHDSSYLVTGSQDTTVILWRIHRAPSHLNNNVVETSSSTPRTPTSPLVGSSLSDSASETTWRRRIEGPLHVLRGHLREVACCCVNSDLGLIASCSSISGVLLHSMRRGRLVRKLDVGEVQSICLSSQGVILIWNQLEKRIHTFTVNGVPIATKILSPFPGSISCIEISRDGENALIGTSSCRDDKTREVCSLEVSTAHQNHPNLEETQSLPSNHQSNENEIAIPVPSICFINLHTLKVFHTLALGEGQDVTAIALDEANTNLFVSTADKQLIVFTNPSEVEPEGKGSLDGPVQS